MTKEIKKSFSLYYIGFVKPALRSIFDKVLMLKCLISAAIIFFIYKFFSSENAIFQSVVFISVPALLCLVIFFWQIFFVMPLSYLKKIIKIKKLLSAIEEISNLQEESKKLTPQEVLSWEEKAINFLNSFGYSDHIESFNGNNIKKEFIGFYLNYLSKSGRPLQRMPFPFELGNDLVKNVEFKSFGVLGFLRNKIGCELSKTINL